MAAPFDVWASQARPGMWARLNNATDDVTYHATWEEAMGLAPVPDPELIEPCS